jgi:uncharacterized membrane protein YvbJ
MKCFLCGAENPATVSYCKACGKKLDLTHEEIQNALREKATQESAQSVETQATQYLVLAVAFFLLMLTLRVMAAGMRPAEDQLVFIPSASLGDKATYAETPYEFLPPLDVDPLPVVAPPAK